jgi:ABC-type antimicrobial peptide transport system permease subunit
MQSFLFGVSAFDVATIATVALVALAAAIAIAWLPARRAAAVDPVAALKE